MTDQDSTALVKAVAGAMRAAVAQPMTWPDRAQAVLQALEAHGKVIVDRPLEPGDRVWIGVSTNRATVKSGPLHRVVWDHGTIVDTHDAADLHPISAAPRHTDSEESGCRILPLAWLVKVALLLHTLGADEIEFVGETAPWELFMALGPILGFDENYTSDDGLRAMINALPAVVEGEGE